MFIILKASNRKLIRTSCITQGTLLIYIFKIIIKETSTMHFHPNRQDKHPIFSRVWVLENYVLSAEFCSHFYAACSDLSIYRQHFFSLPINYWSNSLVCFPRLFMIWPLLTSPASFFILQKHTHIHMLTSLQNLYVLLRDGAPHSQTAK